MKPVKHKRNAKMAKKMVLSSNRGGEMMGGRISCLILAGFAVCYKIKRPTCELKIKTLLHQMKLVPVLTLG